MKHIGINEQLMKSNYSLDSKIHVNVTLRKQTKIRLWSVLFLEEGLTYPWWACCGPFGSLTKFGQQIVLVFFFAKKRCGSKNLVKKNILLKKNGKKIGQKQILLKINFGQKNVW